ADCGSPFFWVLFFGEAKKRTSPAGARPGSRPYPKLAFQTIAPHNLSNPKHLPAPAKAEIGKVLVPHPGHRSITVDPFQKMESCHESSPSCRAGHRGHGRRLRACATEPGRQQGPHRAG